MSYSSTTGAAAWSSYVIGAAAALFATSALWTPASQQEEWVNLALGLWLVIAPFVLGFYAGKVYFFASTENRDRFKGAPQQYASKAAGRLVRPAEAAYERPRRRSGR